MGYVADTLVAVLQVVVYKRLLLQQLLGQYHPESKQADESNSSSDNLHFFLNTSRVWKYSEGYVLHALF
jgi:hypothetical protein